MYFFFNVLTFVFLVENKSELLVSKTPIEGCSIQSVNEKKQSGLIKKSLSELSESSLSLLNVKHKQVVLSNQSVSKRAMRTLPYLKELLLNIKKFPFRQCAAAHFHSVISIDGMKKCEFCCKVVRQDNNFS